MALDQLTEMIQRCQVIPEDGFKVEDYEIFQKAGKNCLEEMKTAEILDIIKEEKNKVIIKCMGWNLLGPLIKIVLKKEKSSLQHCLSMLTHILEVCSPKEVLLGLLEQIEDADMDIIAETIVLLLQPLQTVLLKLGKKKPPSVGMSLSTILNQISQLPVPYTQEQEEDDAHGLCQCCVALLTFTKPFVEEVQQSYTNKMVGDMEELRNELLKFCIKCLSNPLLHVQLEKVPEVADELPMRRFATEIVEILCCTGESLSALVFHRLLSKKEEPGFLEEDAKYSKDSLACLSYLIFVQHLGMNKFPLVYSPEFILHCNMLHIETLMKRKEESVLSKALDLFEKTLLRTNQNSVTVQFLEITCFLNVPQALVQIMTLCPIQHLRTKGLQIFQLYIDIFDVEGKYKLFRCLLEVSHHAGVEGYIIQNIKKQIDLALKPDNGNLWFSGAALLPLLRLVLFLPQGPETDLLQNLDRIMESLNLLRYLLIRDKEYDNQTGIWTELYKIEDNFLKPLHTGLNMSKAHYEAELKNTKENKKHKESKEENPLCTLSVAGEKLPNMTTEMQLQVLQSAMFTFDLIESVLARIEEIIEVKAKK